MPERAANFDPLQTAVVIGVLSFSLVLALFRSRIADPMRVVADALDPLPDGVDTSGSDSAGHPEPGAEISAGADRVDPEFLGTIDRTGVDPEFLGTIDRTGVDPEFLETIDRTGIVDGVELEDSNYEPIAVMKNTTKRLDFAGIFGTKWVSDGRDRRLFKQMLQDVRRQPTGDDARVRFLLLNPSEEGFNQIEETPRFCPTVRRPSVTRRNTGPIVELHRPIRRVRLPSPAVQFHRGAGER